MAHTELDLRERRAIEDMLNAKMPVSKIATEIGRHRSTVYREIKRTYFIDDELPHPAMHRPRYEGDLRSPQQHAPKMPRMEDASRSLPRKDDGRIEMKPLS